VQELTDILIQKLSKKGMTSTEILRIIKDVIYIVRDDGEYTLKGVSQKLGALGWQKHIIDGATLDLIVWIAENNNQCNVQQYTLH
jgi:hypothetical protein